jgi:hypothetical protein
MPSNNSFINANNKNPRELADLLINLIHNENKYNTFFEFKNQPLSREFLDITKRSYTHPNVLCRLCDYVIEHKKRVTTVIS